MIRRNMKFWFKTICRKINLGCYNPFFNGKIGYEKNMKIRYHAVLLATKEVVG